jgi:hypothetical protein
MTILVRPARDTSPTGNRGAACWLLWIGAHAALGTRGAVGAGRSGGAHRLPAPPHGHGYWPALILIAAVGLVGLVWVVIVLVALGIVVS